MSHDDFENEPVPGLPARLPQGEHIVWQGKPDQDCFLRSVLHMRKICIYFGLIFIWNIGTGIYDGKDILSIVLAGVLTILSAVAVYGLGWWFARAIERTTIYTITNKRVVMRFGVALPVTFNFPFSQIVSADVRDMGEGHGVISLSLKEHTKISAVILWPHVRPWKFAKPQPSLRAIPDVIGVAQILADGLRATHGQAKANVAAQVTTTGTTVKPAQAGLEPNIPLASA